jgi:hypothetical protein
MSQTQTSSHDLDPAIPRVLCPSCGRMMRLAQVGPDVTGQEQMKFDCACGFEYQLSSAAQAEIRGR